MCVALFALDHPDYALVLCSNRDEYLARPTQPACFHSFGRQVDPDVLSGVDVEAGGTWLGLSRAGKLGLLTNITEPHGTYPSSRGHLVASFLTSPASPLECVPPDARYAGFNLLLLQPADAPVLTFDALHVTNHGGGGPIAYRALTPAQRHLYGLSNGVDGAGADDWPKLQHGVHALGALLDALPKDTSDDQLAERLFEILAWRSSQPPRDRSELKHTLHVDPVCIAGDVYGTRLSTVVLVRHSGQVLFCERDRWRLDERGTPVLADPSSQRVFRFKIAKGGLV